MKIKNNKEPKKNIKSNNSKKSNGNGILFSFDFFYTGSIKTKFFTNYYSNSDDFSKSYKLFLDIIANSTGKTLEEIRGIYKHVHVIHEEKNKNNYRMIKKIIEEIDLNESLHNIDISEFFQLGGSNGFRIIGIKIDMKYYPLFLDPHHLIFESEKYNDKDTNNFKYDKVKKKTIDRNITIINFEDAIQDKCLDCDVLKKYFKAIEE